MANALINVPPRAKRGEIIEIKTLISHPMETGYRRTQTGGAVPRDIIRTFVATYNGVEIFRAELHPAIAANPFIAFSTAPGLTASDGLEDAQNSPFTSSVLKHIETADMRISDLMLTVRQEVYAATGGQQLPWENSSLLLPFSFNQKKEDLGGPEDLAKANRQREDAHWHLAEQSQNPPANRESCGLSRSRR